MSNNENRTIQSNFSKSFIMSDLSSASALNKQSQNRVKNIAASMSDLMNISSGSIPYQEMTRIQATISRSQYAPAERFRREMKYIERLYPSTFAGNNLSLLAEQISKQASVTDFRSVISTRQLANNYLKYVDQLPFKNMGKVIQESLPASPKFVDEPPYEEAPESQDDEIDQGISQNEANKFFDINHYLESSRVLIKKFPNTHPYEFSLLMGILVYILTTYGPTIFHDVIVALSHYMQNFPIAH
ncbi:hypothetical protein [Furfurilactobacillus siliginis]|nr:hypothetical protein [Furfurilactobacillus siliginis]GEK28490.1 hypothetical protein LSI01_08010 [Furfurilactobacillus siliginis]